MQSEARFNSCLQACTYPLNRYKKNIGFHSARCAMTVARPEVRATSHRRRLCTCTVRSMAEPGGGGAADAARSEKSSVSASRYLRACNVDVSALAFVGHAKKRWCVGG